MVDAAHRLASVIDGRGDRMLRYSYSPGGLLNSLQDNEGRRTDYQYDRVGRLSNIWAPNGDVVELLYDAGGRLVEKNLASGVSSGTGVNTRYAYNADNTLQQVVNNSGVNLMSQHTFTYDPVGNRQTHQEQICETPSTFYTYVYDELNRLTQVQGGAGGTEIYTYDALGNRLTKASGGTTLNYVYDDANQLNKIQQAGADVATFHYDDNGNLDNKTDSTGTMQLGYDSLDRLVQATKTWEQPQTYQYDDQGRRISKSVGSKVTNYVYNGQDIIAEYTGTWNNAAASYTHGSGTDQPLIRTTGAATPISQYYHQDGLGSVTAVTDQNGATVGTARYDAWGNKLSGNGGIPQYGYTGREPDENGLIFYRGRYYDPTIGRFIQRDPIGMQGGMNLYEYVGGNPTNYTDPSGLDAIVSRTGNNVSLEWRIVYTGPGANPKNTARFNAGITEQWAGNYAQAGASSPQVTYAVSARVTSVSSQDPKVVAQYVSQGYTQVNVVPSGSSGLAEDGAGQRTRSTQGVVGNWNEDASGWEAGHEVGHIALLMDRYRGSGTPLPGWEGDIMAQYGGESSARTIQGILGAANCLNSNCSGVSLSPNARNSNITFTPESSSDTNYFNMDQNVSSNNQSLGGVSNPPLPTRSK